MNKIQQNAIRSSHLFKESFFVNTQATRTIFSLFKTKYWHGTSYGAIGEEQIRKGQFEPRESFYASHLWATPDKELAKSYARRSAQRTNSSPILVRIETQQTPEYLDYGKHNYEAFNAKTAPIYIKEIELLDK